MLLLRFEHFNIIRQGLLLAIDTFGVSHILPILSLPVLVILQNQNTKKNQAKDALFFNLTKVKTFDYIWYYFSDTHTYILLHI